MMRIEDMDRIRAAMGPTAAEVPDDDLAELVCDTFRLLGDDVAAGERKLACTTADCGECAVCREFYLYEEKEQLREALRKHVVLPLSDGVMCGCLQCGSTWKLGTPERHEEACLAEVTP
jgi:hypothetical protein